MRANEGIMGLSRAPWHGPTPRPKDAIEHWVVEEPREWEI